MKTDRHWGGLFSYLREFCSAYKVSLCDTLRNAAHPIRTSCERDSRYTGHQTKRAPQGCIESCGNFAPLTRSRSARRFAMLRIPFATRNVFAFNTRANKKTGTARVPVFLLVLLRELESRTLWLKVKCSTNWATGAFKSYCNIIAQLKLFVNSFL